LDVVEEHDGNACSRVLGESGRSLRSRPHSRTLTRGREHLSFRSALVGFGSSLCFRL